MHEIWQMTFLWNTIAEWSLAGLTFLVTLTLLPLIKSFASAQQKKWLERNRNRQIPLALEIAILLVTQTSRIFLWTVALFLALYQLDFPYRIERVLDVAIVLTFWYQFGKWLVAVVRLTLQRQIQRPGYADPALSSSLTIIHFIAGLVIWTLAFLLALDNLGVQIKPLLAGLGIGGIAVALAVQTVLGDLLASLSIALDKPFVVGDALQVDDINGSVEHIGIKSTRLRSISGEQVIISNADILKSRVRNHGRLRERRTVFVLNIAYGTSAQVLEKIPKIIQEIISKQSQVRFDRCHLLYFTDWALRFEVVFFTTVPDYGRYADTQQTINLAIVQRFAELGIEFAQPTRA
jgi:small-conductance mechanosensitive channel